jgi:hypothetical protein
MRTSLALVAPLTLCCVLSASASEESATAADCVHIMTSEAEPWARRCEAEDRLHGCDAESVLSALLPHVSKGMPAPPIWNSLGREHDREAPIEWQIYYAVDRSWRHHLRGAPSEELGALLLVLLERADSVLGRQRILFDLSRHWHPDAEEPLRRRMLDPEQDLLVRRPAAYALVLHRSGAYHDTFLDLASGSTGEERREWWKLLADPRHKGATGIDPAVVRLGFDVLAEEMEANPDHVHGAYFIACTIGGYVEQEFKPDQDSRKHRGPHGLRESFFADTVENALAWWEAHRGDYEPTPTAGGSPAFSLTIEADRAQYIRLEPIRILVMIENRGEEAYTLRHAPDRDAAKVVFFRVLDGGELSELGTRTYRTPLFCGTPPLPTWLDWSIERGVSPLDTYWDHNRFDAGPVTIRATFTRLVGPGLGTPIVSNDVTLTIVEPEGRDAEAHAFLTRPGAIKIGERHWSLGSLDGGLVYSSGSHLGRQLHEEFLRRYGGSLYAHYVRFTMASYSSLENQEHGARLFAEIVERAPRDFPLLPEAYLNLLSFYREESELERLHALSQEVNALGLSTIHPKVAEGLSYLTSYVRVWPPETPEERAAADAAARIVAARTFAREHWLPDAMMSAYGEHGQNQRRRFDVSGPPDVRATIDYYDPRQSWPLAIEYRFREDGAMDTVGFRGSLESFAIGRLGRPFRDLVRQHELTYDEALRTFVEATMSGSLVEGVLTLPSKERVPFSFEVPITDK